MKMNDDYKVIRKTTELITEHLDYTRIQQTQPDIEVAIIQAYKASENKLLNHIGEKVKSIGTITDLVNCFRFTCQGFYVLGSRADLLESSLVVTHKDELEILEETIKKDIFDDFKKPWQLEYPLSNDPIIGGITFDRLFDPDEYDRKALASMLLLEYLIDGNYTGLNIGDVLYDIQYSSCISPLLDKNWIKRPLIGYFNEGTDYIFESTNKKFITIFAKALRNILNRDNSLEAIQIKKYLHNQLLTAWGRSNYSDALKVYIEIEALIAESKSGQELTLAFIGKLDSCKNFAVKRHYATDMIAYEINYESLVALSNMLKTLGLDDLQEASYFIDMVQVLNE
jgi:hypothetical protein